MAQTPREKYLARKAYVLDHKEEYYKYQRKSKLWIAYRLTEEEWQAIFDFQGGVCAISGKPQNIKLSTDHNHKTGLIRGLLSIKMNRGLAYFNDDPVLLRKAADYLENPTAIKALGKEVYGLIGKANQYKKIKIYGSPSGPIKAQKKEKK